LASTWPSNDLLPAIRSALDGADDAILCVAFANRRGVNLLQPRLSALGHRCRLLVTSVFGGPTTGDALAVAADLRVHVRITSLQRTGQHKYGDTTDATADMSDE
jgi:hypothetical protein